MTNTTDTDWRELVGSRQAMRTLIGTLLIKAGMKILPSDVRRMARNIALYHVPGALTDHEKKTVVEAKNAWKESR